MKNISSLERMICRLPLSRHISGIQKEACILGVPCVTMQENTEWAGTVEYGWNVLMGADYEEIVYAIRGFEVAGEGSGVFGMGDASENILEII